MSTCVSCGVKGLDADRHGAARLGCIALIGSDKRHSVNFRNCPGDAGADFGTP